MPRGPPNRSAFLALPLRSDTLVDLWEQEEMAGLRLGPEEIAALNDLG